MLRFLLSIIALIASIYAIWILLLAVFHLFINKSSKTDEGDYKYDEYTSR